MVIETWSEVKGSIEPSWYVIEYFSASNGSKNALVIPALASNPDCEVNVSELLTTFWSVICLLIVKFELAKLTFEILGLGNSVNIPDLSRFKTLGTLILNGLVVVSLVPNVPPSLIPETVWVEANVNVFPSVEILVTLLKTGSVESAPIKAIIESVLIPTLPAKLRLIAVAAVPTILIWSAGENPDKTRSYNTVSAANVDIPDEDA